MWVCVCALPPPPRPLIFYLFEYFVSVCVCVCGCGCLLACVRVCRYPLPSPMFKKLYERPAPRISSAISRGNCDQLIVLALSLIESDLSARCTNSEPIFLFLRLCWPAVPRTRKTYKRIPGAVPALPALLVCLGVCRGAHLRNCRRAPPPEFLRQCRGAIVAS